ncbi:YhgE/Pip domain-containing protein [Niallia oryzisoli]|uniref:YhgE/Pip domain-containing protein n=1 Tax=Niallia oryzisoli TaxID=1737571 RepID=A0ABZ2CHD4_9BACI
MDEEIKTNQRSMKRLMIVAVIAILFVPILYSGIYLSSFWDPYGHFDRVPVAFVNQDKPVVKNGTEFHLGKDIQENLKDNKSIGWHFVSYNQAKKGIEGTKYYALIVIPEDFSKKISESNYGKFEKPKIIYEANKGKNYVFAQVSERAAENIKAEVASNIQKETTKALANNLFAIRDSLGDASTGAADLQEGTSALAAGADQLSSGLNTSASGSDQLKEGLEEAAGGQSKLAAGMGSLLDGLHQFKSGLTQSTGDVSALSAGAASVSDGLGEMNATLEKAKLSEGLQAAADSIGSIKGAISQASTVLASSNDPASIAQARGILEQLVTNINNQNLEGNLQNAATSTGDLVVNLQRLNGGAKQVAEGTNTIEDTLTETQEQASAGVDKLISGAEELQTGSNDLLEGLQTAAANTGELSSGLHELHDGAIDLNEGMAAADQGALDLKEGLENGYNEMNDNLTFTVEGISNFIKNPLAIEDQTINQVNTYGEGLAPYFISLSLWLGAMLMNLVLSLVKLSKVITSKFWGSYIGTFIAGAILVMLQAVILTVILVNGLGMEAVSIPVFYLGNMFISLVFFSIMYGMSFAAGLVATPIVFILFILQLASSGGTFPIETSPEFFRAISPYFPMTYTVEALRMITSGINTSRMQTIALILLMFLLLFAIGGYAVKWIMNRKSTRRLAAQ